MSITKHRFLEFRAHVCDWFWPMFIWPVITLSACTLTPAMSHDHDSWIPGLNIIKSTLILYTCVFPLTIRAFYYLWIHLLTLTATRLRAPMTFWKVIKSNILSSSQRASYATSSRALGIIHFQPCGQKGCMSLSVLPRRKITLRIMTSLHGIILQLSARGSCHQSSLQPLVIHFSHIAFRWPSLPGAVFCVWRYNPFFLTQTWASLEPNADLVMHTVM